MCDCILQINRSGLNNTQYALEGEMTEERLQSSNESINNKRFFFDNITKNNRNKGKKRRKKNVLVKKKKKKDRYGAERCRKLIIRIDAWRIHAHAQHKEGHLRQPRAHLMPPTDPNYLVFAHEDISSTAHYS